MATAILLEWPKVTRSQFRRLAQNLPGLVDSYSDGFAFEATRGGGRLVVLKTWESASAFEQFARSALRRAALKAGLPAPSIQAWAILGRTAREGEAVSDKVVFGAN